MACPAASAVRPQGPVTHGLGSLLLGLALLAAAAPRARAYTLVLTDGRRVELVAEPAFRDGWADVQAKDGRRARLPVLLVAWVPTNAANGNAPSHRSPGAAERKVWTNADLEPLRRAGFFREVESSVAGGAPVAAGAPAAGLPAPAVAGEAGEAAWKARARAISERIETNERRIAEMESQEHAWESLALNMPSLAGGAASELIQVREALAAARADLAAAQAALDALQDEARRAGVLPGWLR